MYKRLSSHLTSMDLPDLPDFPDAFRETASRVECALQQARSSYESHTRKERESGGGSSSSREDEKGSSEHSGSKEGSESSRHNSTSRPTSIVED